MIELRDYQRDVLLKLKAELDAGRRRVCIVAPTGSGKTVLAGQVIKEAHAAGKQVMFVAHRREIIFQTKQKLEDVGIRVGLIIAGEPMDPDATVQVASVQTLHARAFRTRKLDLSAFDLIFFDEAHHCRAATYQQIVDRYQKALIAGLTATPVRGDGKGLGNLFEVLVETPQVKELTEAGWLVPTVVYAPSRPDLHGVEVRQGDYVLPQLARRCNTEKLVGDIVTHWRRHGGGRPTICFAVDVEHSAHIKGEFTANGVRAEHIDAKTPKEDRDRILKQLADGELDVVSNCMVFTEGWDCPPVSCCIMARPTKQLGLWRQMLGRILRPADGKTNSIILDHTGGVFDHGFVDDHIQWTLHTDRRAVNKTKLARMSGIGKTLKDCPRCGAVRLSGEKCGNCDWYPQAPGSYVAFAHEELALIDRKKQPIIVPPTAEEKQRWIEELTYYAKEKGRKFGWVYYAMQEKFGLCRVPKEYAITPRPTSFEVRAWIRSRDIAYATRRAS